jgi:hypothetical protein
MARLAAFIILAVALAACGFVGTLVDGWKHATAVEKDLETVTGLTPKVGFNWVNGRLVTVTVTFPRLYEAKPLREVADAVRRSVMMQFNQTPGDIVLGFSLGKTPSGTSAALRVPRTSLQSEAL